MCARQAAACLNEDAVEMFCGETQAHHHTKNSNSLRSRLQPVGFDSYLKETMLAEACVTECATAEDGLAS
jgi:hypothetical protein